MKKISVLGIIVVLLLAACGTKTIEFTERGSFAVRRVEDLSERMKVPDSFKLRKDVIVIDRNNNDETERYTYIEYSSENSYGAAIKNIAMYYNIQYLGSFDDYDLDKLDEEITKNAMIIADYATFGGTGRVSEKEATEAQLSNDENRIIKRAINTYYQWNRNEIEENYELVPCADIGQQLGIEYIEK